MNIDGVGLTVLEGVGKKRAELFSGLGIETIRDLLSFLPRTYIDLSQPVPITQVIPGQTAVIRAYVSSPVHAARIRGGKTLFKFIVSDGAADMQIVLFNQEYTAQKMVQGSEFIFYGAVELVGRRLQMTAPLIEEIKNATVLPVYRLTKGLSQNVIRKTVDGALDRFLPELDETLPELLLRQYDLMPIRQAYMTVHHPSDMQLLQNAQRRFAFEELLLFSLGIGTLRAAGRKREGVPLNAPCDMQAFFSLFPYTFTDAQTRALNDCIADLKRPAPMARMIQGDVGCGKTAVAAAVVYYVAANGKQSCFMAPTEILAVQHYRFFDKLFSETDITVRLLTGSTKVSERKSILAGLESGEIDLLIGTHAVIEDSVHFHDLALTVTDEQHRFGVAQRSRLADKGKLTHTLVMSATPIPRTLALIIYGDLDVSVIDELPPGRKPVSTFLVGSDYHTRMYKYLREQISQGAQAYVVCPLVEEGADGSVRSAVEYAKELASLFLRGIPLRYLHGKMRGTEKEETLNLFASGEVKVLVSTTVIEVGVDVPGANIMIIENAERFGLAQLHQLRGRVGRGVKKSYCFLVSDTQNAQTRERLEAFCSTCNGFEISRKDLQMRGPGDFFGHRQSGLPLFRYADLIRDMEWLKQAQSAAESIASDPEWFRDPCLIKLKYAVMRLFEGSDFHLLS